MPRTCPDCKSQPVATGRSYCQPCNTKRVADWRRLNLKRRQTADRAWSKQQKDKIIQHYGGACACCGETTREFLCLDHKLNNGNAERRTYHSQTWKLALKRGLPDDYQLLCYNCNNARSHYGICPHQNRLTHSRSSLSTSESSREAPRLVG